MSWIVLDECAAPGASLIWVYLDDQRLAARIVGPDGAEISREQIAAMQGPVRIEVRASDMAQARQILADVRPDADRPRVDESLERLGKSIRACVMPPFSVWGLALAPKYLSRSARSAVKPREHAWNLAAIGVCAAFTLVGVTLAVDMIAF